jgi:hypothetical protein
MNTITPVELQTVLTAQPDGMAVDPEDGFSAKPEQTKQGGAQMDDATAERAKSPPARSGGFRNGQGQPRFIPLPDQKTWCRRPDASPIKIWV